MFWPFSLFVKKRSKLSEPQYLISTKPLTHDQARAALRGRASLEREQANRSWQSDPVIVGVDPTALIVEEAIVTAASMPDAPPAFQGFGGGDLGGGGASDDWGSTAATPTPDPSPSPSCDTNYSAPDPSPSFDSGTCDTSSSLDSGSSSFDS
jgi:hypothetical protein